MFRSVWGLLRNPCFRLAPILGKSVLGSKIVWDLTPAGSLPSSRSSGFLGCSGVTLRVLTHIVGHFSLESTRLPVLKSHLWLTPSLGAGTSVGLQQTCLRSEISLGNCSWSACWSGECPRPQARGSGNLGFRKSSSAFWGIQLIRYTDFLRSQEEGLRTDCHLSFQISVWTSLVAQW